MSVPIRDFLTNRRNRALGSILGHAEREIFPQLSTAKQETFRTLVRDAINSYHDSVLDLVKAEDGVRNEEVVAALERLEASVRRGRSAQASSNGRPI
jgi:hypothetical protein